MVHLMNNSVSAVTEWIVKSLNHIYGSAERAEVSAESWGECWEHSPKNWAEYWEHSAEGTMLSPKKHKHFRAHQGSAKGKGFKEETHFVESKNCVTEDDVCEPVKVTEVDCKQTDHLSYLHFPKAIKLLLHLVPGDSHIIF